MQCCLEISDVVQGLYLRNVVPSVLKQNCTGFFLTKCCLEPLGQQCIGFCPVRCCPNLYQLHIFYELLFCYNHCHNILRLFDVLTNFPFTKSETMHNYYLKTRNIRVAERLKIQDLRKLGNIRKVSKPHRMIAQCPVFLSK